MHAQHRLRESAAFDRARKRGRSWSSSLLALSAVRNDLDVTRCGFVVSRRVGKAVVRNTVRRRLREIVRRLLAQLPPGWDLVLSARPAAAAATYLELEETVRALLDRAPLRST
jgi:ribonuclease P protein component